MRTRRLPSGNYQAIIPIGKDPSGKYRYKSFTAKTEASAKAQARKWKDAMDYWARRRLELGFTEREE